MKLRNIVKTRVHIENSSLDLFSTIPDEIDGQKAINNP